jgi:predicted transcriptional regulator
MRRVQEDGYMKHSSIIPSPSELRTIRTRCGLTQREAARVAGCSLPTWSRLEGHGRVAKHGPDFPTIQCLRKFVAFAERIGATKVAT